MGCVKANRRPLARSLARYEFPRFPRSTAPFLAAGAPSCQIRGTKAENKDWGQSELQIALGLHIEHNQGGALSVSLIGGACCALFYSSAEAAAKANRTSFEGVWA